MIQNLGDLSEVARGSRATNKIRQIMVSDGLVDTGATIGQIPLEMLDLVVDPQGRRLIGNPEHDGEHNLELF